MNDDFRSRVKLALIGVAFAFALGSLLFIFFDEIYIPAHAVDTILTPQQTVALIGTSFDIEYYNSRSGLTSSYTADLVGSTLDRAYWDYNGYSDAGDTIPFSQRGFNSDSTITNKFYAPALVYRAYIPNYQTTFFSSNPSDRYNLSFSFSINLSGLSRFRFVTMPSIIYSTTQYPRNASWTANTSLGLLEGSASLNSQTNRYERFFFFAGEAAYASTIESAFCFAYYDADITGDNFSLNGINYGVQLARAVSASYVAPDYGYQQEQGGWYYILIECPIIDGVLPETTTTNPPAYTTRPHDYSNYATTPANTIDLSQIEENQRIQIEIENDNRNYNAGTFDGVNIIIDQLNDIYSLMQARGEIAVDLLDAPDLPSDPSISRYVDDSLESFTTAQLPPETLTGGISFIGSLVSWFTDSFGWLWVLAGLNLTLAVLSFAIFRSKGG